MYQFIMHLYYAWEFHNINTIHIHSISLAQDYDKVIKTIENWLEVYQNTFFRLFSHFINACIPAKLLFVYKNPFLQQSY